MNNQDKYNTLKQKYKKIIYKSYSYIIKEDVIEINYHFEIEHLCIFNPKWTINRLSDYNDFNINKVENLIFNLGMVELVSYYKAVCCNDIEIQCAYLSNKQIEFYKKLYMNGLGEFFYINGIDPNTVNMNIYSTKTISNFNIDNEAKNNNKVLVPVGGGKDSVVSIELLKNKFDITCYIINPRLATNECFTNSNVKNKLIVKRELDKTLIQLNNQGYLNGHTPYSAIVAFSSVLSAYINGISYVALSNEDSANESTIVGTNINHQYSKSFEFEQDFINYHKEFINTNVDYFSLLRGYSESKIASIFSKHTQYHNVFKSCNVGSFTDIWCGNCPKCLFVYIILSPFLTKEQLFNIFNKNLLDDKSLIEDFLKLCGILPEKPFECVGSIEEVNASIQYTIENYKGKLPNLLQYYKDNYKGNKYDIKDILNEFNNTNAIPELFKGVLL